MGCGRVGAALAVEIESHGHSVAIIDADPGAFRKLPASFTGQQITGVGFDRDVLASAGIEKAYAFAAISDGDNSNVIAARVARENFNVQHVVARIYDMRRAEIYQRIGIPTVASVRWSTNQMLRRMLPVASSIEFEDASGHIVIAQVNYAPGWVGRSVPTIEGATGAKVAYLTRYDSGIPARWDTMLQEHDLLHLLAPREGIDAASRVLAAAPTKEA